MILLGFAAYLEGGGWRRVMFARSGVGVFWVIGGGGKRGVGEPSEYNQPYV